MEHIDFLGQELHVDDIVVSSANSYSSSTDLACAKIAGFTAKNVRLVPINAKFNNNSISLRAPCKLLKINEQLVTLAILKYGAD